MRKIVLCVLVSSLALLAACAQSGPAASPTTAPKPAAVPTSVPVAPAAPTAAPAPATAPAPSVVATAPAKASGEPYKIGASIDITGPSNVSCGPILRGAQSMAFGVNAAGGVNGRPIQLIADDTRGMDVAAETALFKKHIERDGVLAEIGCNASSVSANVKYFNDQKVPMVSSATATAWFDKGADFRYIFSLQPPPELTGATMLGYLAKAAETTRGKKVGVVVLEGAAGQAIGQALPPEAAKLGLEVLPVSVAPASQVDYSSTVLKLMSSGADLLLTAVTPGMLMPMHKAVQAQGWRKPWIGTWSAGDDELKAGVGQYAGLRYWTVPTEAAISADTQKVVQIAKAAGFASDSDLRSYWFASGWLQVGAIVEGLKKCGPNCTSTSLRDAMDNLKVEAPGVMAPSSYTPTKHWLVSNVRVYTWNDKQSVGEPLSDWIDLLSPSKYTGKAVAP